MASNPAKGKGKDHTNELAVAAVAGVVIVGGIALVACNPLTGLPAIAGLLFTLKDMGKAMNDTMAAQFLVDHSDAFFADFDKDKNGRLDPEDVERLNDFAVELHRSVGLGMQLVKKAAGQIQKPENPDKMKKVGAVAAAVLFLPLVMMPVASNAIIHDIKHGGLDSTLEEDAAFQRWMLNLSVHKHPMVISTHHVDKPLECAECKASVTDLCFCYRHSMAKIHGWSMTPCNHQLCLNCASKMAAKRDTIVFDTCTTVLHPKHPHPLRWFPGSLTVGVWTCTDCKKRHQGFSFQCRRDCSADFCPTCAVPGKWRDTLPSAEITVSSPAGSPRINVQQQQQLQQNDVPRISPLHVKPIAQIFREMISDLLYDAKRNAFDAKRFKEALTSARNARAKALGGNIFGAFKG